MEYPRPKAEIGDQKYEILSFEEFKDRAGLINTSNATISYNVENNHLDFIYFGRFRYIIWNKKAQTFSIANRRPRNNSKLSM